MAGSGALTTGFASFRTVGVAGIRVLTVLPGCLAYAACGVSSTCGCTEGARLGTSDGRSATPLASPAATLRASVPFSGSRVMAGDVDGSRSSESASSGVALAPDGDGRFAALESFPAYRCRSHQIDAVSVPNARVRTAHLGTGSPAGEGRSLRDPEQHPVPRRGPDLACGPPTGFLGFWGVQIGRRPSAKAPANSEKHSGSRLSLMDPYPSIATYRYH